MFQKTKKIPSRLLNIDLVLDLVLSFFPIPTKIICSLAEHILCHDCNSKRHEKCLLSLFSFHLNNKYIVVHYLISCTIDHQVSTSFSDVLAFSGPGPERINGRLAMIGFVTAMGVELANGQDIFSQVQNGGIPWFLGTSVLLSLASLIPMFKGVTAESKSGDLWTSDAELWNGRFAMIGLVALAFTEYVKGSALVWTHSTLQCSQGYRS